MVTLGGGEFLGDRTIVEPVGTLRYANPAWERILGYDPEQAVGKMNVLDHVHPEDLAHVLEETEKALAEGDVATNEAEYRFRHRDGSWRWMESVGTYLLEDSVVGGVVVTSRDVTRHKEAETRLREAKEKYRTLIEQIPVVNIDHVDETSSAIYISPQVEEMIGYTPEEWLEDPELWKKCFIPKTKRRVFSAAYLGMLGGLVGLHARQMHSYGRLGAVGFFLGFAGTALAFVGS